MKTLLLLCFAVVMLFSASHLMSQSLVEISQPELELRDNTILISYEILKSSDDDFFRIWIEVTDENGNKLNARALGGDVGADVRGGGSKLISWDYERDLATLDAGIFVQVFGELTGQGVVPDHPETKERSAVNMDSPSGAPASKTGAVLRSVAFPGWGLSYMDKGSLHLVKGVAAYGAIATSVVMNRMALGNYNKYLDSSDQGEFGDYFDLAVNQQKISRISVYVAAGIWVTDIVWTLLSDTGSGSYQSNRLRKGFSFGTGYEPVSQAPMVAFRYSF